MEAEQECYGFYEDVRVIGIIKRIDRISVLGQTVMAESIISEEEVKGILETILQDQGYRVENIKYDTGLASDDYPLACGSTPYFKAINVEVKKDVKQKMKGMSE